MRQIATPHFEKPPQILLVDDNHQGLIARKSVLHELGYSVVTATGGEEALELLGRQSFDVIVTDYKMPRMDGVVRRAAGFIGTDYRCRCRNRQERRRSWQPHTLAAAPAHQSSHSQAGGFSGGLHASRGQKQRVVIYISMIGWPGKLER
jgi:hypothetical protein